MTDADLDAIKKELAVRNGIVIGDDDPILMMATAVDVLLIQCVKELNAQNIAYLDKFHKNIDDSIAMGIAQSKTVTSRIITGATDYTANQVTEAGMKILKECMAKNDEMRHELHVARSTSVGAAIAAVVAAMVSLVALSKMFGIL